MTSSYLPKLKPCQRLQNLHFQSHFSVSKIGQIFPKNFFCEEYLIRRQGNQNWEEIKEDFSNELLKALDKTIMPNIKLNARDIFCMTPEDFKKNYRTPFGSGFSISPILTQSAWFRTHNQDDRYKNLFYVGAGTHPGAGVPGVINSAKVVEKIIYP